jgi:hypothetical protein
MSELTLKKHQIEHFARILAILENGTHYMDFSRMGTGKTFVCGQVAKILGLSLGVICPVSAQNTWNQLKQYGVDIVFNISYQSLRGTDKYPPKHGLLERDTELRIDKAGREKRKTIFTPTDEFMQLVNDGLLLVFDEGHNIKNKSDQSKAAIALSSCIQGVSKCAFISGSPYDKEEHSENILRFLFIITQKRLIWSNPLTGEKIPKGISEVVLYCRSLDNDRTDEILEEYTDEDGLSTLSASKARSLCHHLFTDIIKDSISSEMMPEESAYPLHMEEAYLCLQDDKLQELKKAIGDLAQAARYKNERIDTERIEWGAVTLAMERIEIIMVDPLITFATSILSKNSMNKVIISVTHLETIDRLLEGLKMYNPLFISGSIKKNDRVERVHRFNTDTKHRVFISTIKTGGVSISLHDTVGDSPRHMLLIPTYASIDIYQASGRVHRTGLLSDAYFYMIYGTNKKTEDMESGEIKVTPILNALSKKKDVLKKLITEQTKVYKLPGEFDHKYYDM